MGGCVATPEKPGKNLSVAKKATSVNFENPASPAKDLQVAPSAKYHISTEESSDDDPPYNYVESDSWKEILENYIRIAGKKSANIVKESHSWIQMQSDCQIGEILACDPEEGDKDAGQIGTVSVVRFGNLHAEDFPYLA